MSLARFRRERKSAVAVLFAGLALPIVGLLGIAVDFGLWNQTASSLSLAASGAALNAVKIAATGQLAADPNYLAEGTTSGTQWFEVQAAHNAGNLVNVVPTVHVTGTTSISATVSYTGTVKSVFGSLFAIKQYPLNVSASATITTAPYLNIEILMDDSSSMQIGATPNDIEDMQYLTTCSSMNEETGSSGGTQGKAGQWYAAYQTSGYTGTLAAPIPGADILWVTGYTPPANYLLTATGNNAGPSCIANNNTSPPFAGAPCAFACHWDNSKAAGTGSDFFEIARSTLSNSTECATQTTVTLGKCYVTLRFDLVKQAVNQVISQMQADDLAIDNLNVGIFSIPGTTGATAPFNYVTPVYPGCTTPPYNTVACQAGGAWTTATNDVGVTPSKPNTAEPGIQPALWTAVTAVTGDTDFHDAMTAMTTDILTASGDGTTAATPVKVLFLVTDGLADYTPPTGSRINGQAINPSDCELFKSMGYTVYVVYTPYYPLMNSFYMSNIKSIAEPMATSTIATNLQACSSGANGYYIEANPNDATSIQNALQTFLQRALAESPARFTL
jgi:Flp pilus assembly protein TadG